MPDIQHLFIPNNEIKLEAEFFPSKNNINKSCVLICHPHPQFGGDMYNNVVSSVFKIFMDNNIAVLRFNFRGVGKSTGHHTDGEGDVSDVKACVDFLIHNLNMAAIFICGYSYGAAIGCSAINYSQKIIGFIAISFPWDFMGEEFKESTQTRKPKLFIQGTLDNIASFDRFDFHYDFYKEPKSQFIIKGADHFYWGYESIISQEVLKFVKNQFGIIP